jgi:hypothetical protein
MTSSKFFKKPSALWVANSTQITPYFQYVLIGPKENLMLCLQTDSYCREGDSVREIPHTTDQSTGEAFCAYVISAKRLATNCPF